MNEEQFKQAQGELALAYIRAGKTPPACLFQKVESQNPFAKFFGVGAQKFDPLASATTLATAQQGLLELTKKQTAEAKAEAKTEADKSNQMMADLIKAGGLDPQKVYELGQVQQQLEREGLPFDIYRQRLAGEEATRQTTQQLAAAYPYLSAAGREATGRALAASERYLRTKQQMPTTAQEIMASKQQQQLAAQAGEADLMRAVAAQQQAAKQFAGTFAGKYISAG